ncbi:site-2 protease family protein [Sutcliffiella halmapala]|uniref:site-2 protease family protein n=1 Tax=Sutcliffiella halmapala TaxID=79882 RepID=UPI001474BCCE|nr:site-2 protease family protein [Sutcliffiella halmapala]
MWDIFLFLFVVVPVVHLIHELGHVLVAKIYNVTQPKIVLGMGPELFRFTLFGINLNVNYIVFLGGYSTTTNEKDEELSAGKVAFISLGGPLFNIVSIILMLPFLANQPLIMVNMFFFFSCWIGFVNLIPFKIGEKKSDGWQVITSLYNLAKSKLV